MRYTKLLPLLFFSVAAMLLASCQTDDDTPGRPDSDSRANVTLSLSVQSSNQTGAATRATYEDGVEGELMRNWTIVAVQGGVIERIFQSQDYAGERARDSVTTRLDDGETVFYTFANINIGDLGVSLVEGGTMPERFDSLAFTVSGSQQSLDGFAATGIPMSNKQVVTIGPATSLVSLEVVRMVAKVRVEVSNPTNDDLKVTQVTLTDITKNAADNLKLLPGGIVDDATGKRAVALNNVADGDTTRKSTFVYTVPTNSQTIAAGGEQTYEFYVNESQARADIGHFVLSVTTDYTVSGEASADSTVRRQRFAFLDWSAIARNEVHVLPVTLRRYRIDLYVRPYTAIGVLPTYDMESDIATINFGLYGHYDIIPRVRDLVTGEYYIIRNDTYQQGMTVNWDSQNTETADLKINSEGLVTDGGGMAAAYDIGGWQDTASVAHYPTVGWNHTAMTPRIECIVGNYTGWAIYTVTANITAGGRDFDLTRRFRITNTYVDLSQLAKKHR